MYTRASSLGFLVHTAMQCCEQYAALTLEGLLKLMDYWSQGPALGNAAPTPPSFRVRGGLFPSCSVHPSILRTPCTCRRSPAVAVRVHRPTSLHLGESTRNVPLGDLAARSSAEIPHKSATPP